MTRLVVRIATAVSLMVGTLVFAFGGLMLLASFLAIDPEDEVPASWYVVPLAVGALPWIGLYVIWAWKMVQRLREQPEAGW